MSTAQKIFKKIILLSLIVFIAVATTNLKSVFANGCDAISDIDDKAECLEKEIAEKEKDYESTSKKLEDIRKDKDEVNKQIANLAGQLNVTQSQIDDLAKKIADMQKALEEIQTNLTDRRVKLSDKIDLRNRVIRNYSKRGHLSDFDLIFGGNFQLASTTEMFNQKVTSETLKIIGALNSEITSFENDKKEAEDIKVELVTSQNNLIAAKVEMDNKKLAAQSEFNVLSSSEEDHEEELEEIEREIAELSKKQQEILNQKSGDSSGSVGDYESPDANVPNPPFKPAFAAFSYGAYTHYNGMSQYGAKGRAEDGQDYEEIIEFYYKTDVEEKDDFPNEISVQGHGTMSFQKYLYGIAEMPSTWPMDALKAQAIAARTYAYRSNKPICTTESCQVYLKSKADNPPSRWKQAVDETEDIILKGNGTSQYSSTTGGYINNVGWDTDGGSWPKDAYEKKAESPWFYWAWYSQTYNFNSSNCGHPHPWLTESEMADILNAWVVYTHGSNSEVDHITPTTTSCWGGDPYSKDEMADKADDYGGSYSSISSVDTEIGNNGQTQKVKFDTNKGSVSIDGATFRTVFNLRAPAYISLRSRLFDLEMRK